MITAPEYEPTAADRRPLPRSYRQEQRHTGLHGAELSLPWARFFTPELRPVQPHVPPALAAGPSRSCDLHEVDEAPARLQRSGYEAVETGWGRTSRGTRVVACLTDMPGVTAAMWDWWFGWHSTDTTRYKLWHPRAHRFCALGQDRSAVPGLTDRQRYVGNVSYVDERIGNRLHRLAIRFVDPASLGFEDQPGETVVCARVGTSEVPVAVGWLVHQVRPTSAGTQMRSRFYLGRSELLDVPPVSTSRAAASRLLLSGPGRALLPPVVDAVARRTTGDAFARDLLQHCAEEMNHLAGFLPQLYEELSGTP